MSHRFLPPLGIATTREADTAAALAILRQFEGRPLEILEAGCGRSWPFKLDFPYVLTGIDLDPHALEIRKNTVQDLDEAILGDLRSVELGEKRFDIVYNSFVLEHITPAEQVLENFASWLRPGGRLILKFPDRDSVYGFITRITPHWVHVFYHRWIMGHRNAGKPGFWPYPTTHDQVIARARFHEFLGQRGLAIEEEYGFGADELPQWQRWLMKGIGAISLGRLASKHTNLLYVIRAKAGE